MQTERNQIPRFFLLLVTVGLLTGGMYFLPEHIGSWEIKQVDMLSALRKDNPTLELSIDSNVTTTDIPEPTNIKNVARPTQTPNIPKKQGQDSPQMKPEEVQRLQEQDAAHQSRIEVLAESESGVVPIEDPQLGRGALAHFFRQLSNRTHLDRPVRIAVLGDSFIEGDIFTDAVREALQRSYGGAGVGLLPLSSEVAGFRMSIRHEFGKWQDISILNKSSAPVPMTGHYYTPNGSGAWVRYTLPTKARNYEQATLYYSAPSATTVAVRTELDTLTLTLEATMAGEILAQPLVVASRNKLHMSLNGNDGARLYGIALEGKDGVSVDNMSIRGNSGTILRGLNEEVGRAFASARPYDLIILQYGLNVVSAKQSNYASYGVQMDKVIERLRSFYPQASILVFSVSDRGQRTASGIQTLKTIPALHQEQRALAQRHGLAFWSVVTAMQRLGGAEKMTQAGQMAKDYTHLSHKGGREVAKLFIQALELEKNYYEAANQ